MTSQSTGNISYNSVQHNYCFKNVGRNFVGKSMFLSILKLTRGSFLFTAMLALGIEHKDHSSVFWKPGSLLINPRKFLWTEVVINLTIFRSWTKKFNDKKVLLWSWLQFFRENYEGLINAIKYILQYCACFGIIILLRLSV
jgi:hypothetical protein